jgi:hypothetical protein
MREGFIPTGYQAVEYREPKKGEWFIFSPGQVMQCSTDYYFISCMIVVEKEAPPTETYAFVRNDFLWL